MAIAIDFWPRGSEGSTLAGAGLSAIGNSVICAAIAVFWTTTTAFAGAAKQVRTQPSKAILFIFIVQFSPIDSVPAKRA